MRFVIKNIGRQERFRGLYLAEIVSDTLYRWTSDIHEAMKFTSRADAQLKVDSFFGVTAEVYQFVGRDNDAWDRAMKRVIWTH